MEYLALSIVASTTIYILFKLASKYNLKLPIVISYNYLFASLLGLSLLSTEINIPQTIHSPWFPIAALIGILFAGMFTLIAKSTQLAGVAITAIATRMSMIIPITCSLFFFDETISSPKILKLAFAFIAVLIAIYVKPEKKDFKWIILLPPILFIGSGLTDTLVKIAQIQFVPTTDVALFSTSLFLISFCFSIIYTVIKFHKSMKELIHFRTILLGAVLGVANFGTLYGFIMALNHSQLESSSVFGINNIAIVILSILIGRLFFSEKISKVNQIGAILCIIAIALLTIW